MADETNPQPGTEANNPQDDSKVAPSKTSFGFSSYSLPTPKSVEAIFEIYLYSVGGITLWVAGTHLLSEGAVNELVLAITAFTMIIKNVLKMWGVKVDDGK